MVTIRYGPYLSEDAETAALLMHHQQHLCHFAVHLGRRVFETCDVQKDLQATALSRLQHVTEVMMGMQHFTR